MAGDIGSYLALGFPISGQNAILSGLGSYFSASDRADTLAQTFRNSHSDPAIQKVSLRQLCEKITDEDGSYNALLEKSALWFSGTSAEELLYHIQASGDKQAYSHVAQLSPISLKVTLSLLQRSRGLDLRECLEMEYRVLRRLLLTPDFQAGRASAPRHAHVWTPSTLKEVTKDFIEEFFQPLPEEIELVLN